MVGDPFLHIGLLAVLICVLLMGVEFAATSVWLPRQDGFRAGDQSPAITGIAMIQPDDPSARLTLSAAIRSAAQQRKLLQEAIAEEELRVLAAAADEVGDEALPDEDKDLAAAPPSDDEQPAPPMALWREAALWTAGMVVIHPASSSRDDEGPRYPVREEYEWLERSQLPSGALTMAPGDRRINPYFSNLAAMSLLHWNPDAVRDWIVWYLTNLNEVDRFGLRGTIYDYVVVNGVERPENDYDSADSYAATFLTLVARYLFATGDAGLIVTNLGKLETIAAVCLALQDEDGLTWAKADRRYKFLMDNAEVYRGLADWSEVLRTLGFWRQGDHWAAVAERVRLAIDRELWVESRGAYTWAKTALGQRAIRQRWYPDIAAQVYPVLYGLIDPAGPRAQSLIAMVNETYPGWPRLSTGDQFPWAVIAYVNAAAGNREMALSFVDAVWDRHLASGRPWPWYNMEAAFMIFTILELTDPGSSLPARR